VRKGAKKLIEYADNIAKDRLREMRIVRQTKLKRAAAVTVLVLLCILVPTVFVLVVNMSAPAICS